MKKVSKKFILPTLSKKKGFIFGCLIGFLVPFLFMLDASRTGAKGAGILIIFLPFTSIICGIAGMVSGGSYSQAKTVLEKMQLNKAWMYLIVYALYILHLFIILLPLYIIWIMGGGLA